ncbi:MAG: ABC transporter permease [Actinomycetes bacterium]
MSGTRLPRPDQVIGTVALQQRRVAFSGLRLAYLSIGLVFVVSAVRQVTGQHELSTSGTFGAAIISAIPIGLAGLGGLWSERSGVVNIGLEGMMIMGTWGAGFAGPKWGVWAGVGFGILLGALFGALHAVATVTFGVDQIISGVAINLLGLGAAQYLSALAFPNQVTQSPQIPSPPSVSIPWLPGAMLTVQNHNWFLVSDLAGIVRAVTYQISYFTIIAVLLLPLTAFLLWRTAFGLRLRSCGEAPYAAETLGVNVYKYKYIAVITSGALAGFGGAYLAVISSIYRDGQTSGRGFIGLAAMIFGNWRPGGLAAGAGLFGYTDALQLRSDSAVHALLLLFAVGLAGFAGWSFYRRKIVQGVVGSVFAVLVLLWYLTTDSLPPQLTYMTPYITTLLMLALASQRLRPPAADGIPYRRGQGG